MQLLIIEFTVKSLAQPQKEENVEQYQLFIVELAPKVVNKLNFYQFIKNVAQSMLLL